MLGKTHVVNSLAILNTTLAINMALESPVSNVNEIVHTNIWKGFDFSLNTPLNLLEYGLLVFVLVSLVFIVIKEKRVKVPMSLWIMIGIGVLSLYFLFDTRYAINILFLYMSFIFGVLLPDIDSHRSILGRYIQGISRSIPHRTITHTIWMVLLIGCMGFYFKNLYVLAMVLGYTLHILQDTLSKQGICWFYPIVGKYNSFGSGAVMKKGRKDFLAYAVGGTGETVIYYISIFMNVACLFYFAWNIIAYS